MAQPINPVLQGVVRDEVISDPALRELYFGSTDTPGLMNQAASAAQKSFLDQPAILQGTAGLSDYEKQARGLAQSGIGSYQPFLNRQEDLIGQGISDLGQQRGLMGEALGGYRSAYGAQQPYLGQAEQRFGSAYGAQQPYFGQAEQQLGSGLGGMFNSLGYGGPSARDLLGQSLQGYDPRMANQFYNPFENQVVGQTIEDVMKAGDQQDIAARAQGISSGGESAFGSRARLGADERRESLGRGLGKALGQIRSGGFNTAQDRALTELQNQRTGAGSASRLEAGFGAQGSDAQRQYAQDLMGLGRGRSDLERQYGQDLLSIGGTRGELQRQLAGDITGVGSGIAGIGANLAGYGSDLGSLGATQQRLRDQDIGTLNTLGTTDRGLEQQILNNQYKQQQATRMAPTQAASYLQGFAPQYKAGQTNINKTYGMPIDPMGMGISAAMSTYRSFRPDLQPGYQYQSSLDELNRMRQNEIDNPVTNPVVTPPVTAPATPYPAPPPAYTPPVPGTGTTFASNPQPNPYAPPQPNPYAPPQPNPYQPRPPQGGGFNGGYI